MSVPELFPRGFPMNAALRLSILVFALTASSVIHSPNANAQRPSLQDLIQNVDRAAVDAQEKSSNFLGFKKVELPKMFDGLVDLRLKRPTLPKFGFLEKLKTLGKPDFSSEASPRGPILSGLGKLFTPQPKSAPSFMDRMLGRTAADKSLLDSSEMDELNGIAQGLQSQANRMTRDAQNNVRDLFGPTENSPQPPLRSARQYQGGTSRN